MIVYVSSAVELFSDYELEALLQTARTNNRSLDITGMLLYKDGNFMQLLEGPKEAVQTLAEKIKRDPRHRGFHALFQQEKDEREFSDWEMGFKKLEGEDSVNLPGYSDFLNVPLNGNELSEAKSKALKLLLNFKQIMR